MVRVLALLHPYFDKELPLAAREMVAEDWAEALKEAPQWAITNAARWWKSDSNKERKRPPVEGDIRARVRVEMEAARAARIHLDRGVTVEPQPVREPPATAEQARIILKSAGFPVKKFGGE